MSSSTAGQIAVIGSGLAGAACARALAACGHAVQVFDKSGRPGGRLATRRVEVTGPDGVSITTHFDHGAVGFSAQSAAFRGFVDQCLREGWLAEWQPRLAPGQPPWRSGARLYVPVPDGPSLSGHLLDGLPARWSCEVNGLIKHQQGWQLQSGTELIDTVFDAVVLAIPPAQAAPLLAQHHAGWASQAQAAMMQPCWSLIGSAKEPQTACDWDVSQPVDGPLAWIMRSESRPGRARPPGQVLWVAHAKPSWSRDHLERSAPWVLQQLQAALGALLAQPIDWAYVAVHRWRYALPSLAAEPESQLCWWDGSRRLGVCGDFLGRCGAEGAWLSAQSLNAAMTGAPFDPAAALAALAVRDRPGMA